MAICCQLEWRAQERENEPSGYWAADIGQPGLHWSRPHQQVKWRTSISFPLGSSRGEDRQEAADSVAVAIAVQWQVITSSSSGSKLARPIIIACRTGASGRLRASSRATQHSVTMRRMTHNTRPVHSGSHSAFAPSPSRPPPLE